jgi:hypothetical protein
VSGGSVVSNVYGIGLGDRGVSGKALGGLAWLGFQVCEVAMR